MTRAIREITDHWPILAGLVGLGIWAGSLQSQVAYLDRNGTSPVRAMTVQVAELTVEVRNLKEQVARLNDQLAQSNRLATSTTTSRTTSAATEPRR